MAQPSIADRIRAARETQVTVGEWTFTIRRPTDLMLAQWQASDDTGVERVRQMFAECVIGWANVKERDLFPGGGDLDVPFDKEGFLEWAEDRLELVTALSKAIWDAIGAWSERAKADAKNS